MDIDKKIKDLTKRIIRQANPESVILFGSFAWGCPGPDSDIDLFIIENSKETRRTRQLKLRKILLDFDMPADILSYTPEEIAERLKIKDFFIKDILTKGKVIYEK